MNHLAQAALPFLFVATVALHANADAPQVVQRFVENHCVDCHAGSEAEGGLDLTSLGQDLAQSESFDRWIRIVDRVRNGEMPPADASAAKPDEIRQFTNAASQWLETHQRREWSELGRVRARRLTNLQLERSLHAILGVDIPLANQLPEEPRTGSFDTLAHTQSMSHFQLKEHLKVVDAALENAFARAIEGDREFKRTFDGRGLSRRNRRRRTREPEVIEGKAVTWSSRLIFYGRLPVTTARESGWYRFTIRARGLKAPNHGGVWCTVRTGRCVSSAPLLTWVGAFRATDDFKTWTFETWLPAGHMLEVRPGDDTLRMARFRGGQVGVGEGGPQNVPGVAIDELVMERFHPNANAERIRSLLLDDLAVESRGDDWRSATVASDSPRQDLARLMARFATRAFRRPASSAEVQPYVELAASSLDEGATLIDALLLGYRSLLSSPRFLYYQEKPGELDGYAIASRLSYFLWNAPPDEELLALAGTDALKRPDVIRTQIRRMLEHPHGKDFVKDFAAQWLDLSDIDFTTPDRRLYPGFDVIVQQAMVGETETFLQDLIDENASVAGLIDADHTFLNERLARFYGIDGVTGDRLVKTTVSDDDHRGGLMTQGAIMKVTANGTTTSPVLRGVWVSERLLGERIPPPPSNVPAIEPDIRGAKTIREQLAKHKSDAACATCHRSIDPPGFALENFDPAGRWRSKYLKVRGRKVTRGEPIDTSYQLASGEEFSDLGEFKKLIVRRPAKLAANVAEKMLAYGTGADISFADRKDVEAVVERSKASGYGFRTLIEEVGASPLFRMK